ncbi:hypothetical protein ACU686_14710 [Yinghuangia aomiensis]
MHLGERHSRVVGIDVKLRGVDDAGGDGIDEDACGVSEGAVSCRPRGWDDLPVRFSRHHASYELRVHWMWTNGVMALAGVGLLCFAGWGVFAAEALETGQGIGAVALAAALGVLFAFAGTAAFHGPATRLRVDASGVGFTRGVGAPERTTT